jgi:arylsulfatase A-like enzyme
VLPQPVSEEVIMAREFRGKVEVDIRNSTQDWDAFTQPNPRGAPNVVVLLWDDTGIGTWDFYGGRVKMPNMQRIVDQGIRYTQFHTTALCSPTRASLLTGRNPSHVGMNTISEATMGFPGLSGHVPHEAAMISEVLQERGWSTFTAGKWHVMPPDEMNMAATRDHWPNNRGFDRSYGFLGGETNQWYPDLYKDNQSIDQPYPPEEGYHLSKDLVDQSIAMIGDAKQVAPDKPFFLYLTPGANHAPHHVAKEWADMYEGVFDDGYEKYAEDTFKKMKDMGIIPESTTLAPMNSMADATNSEGVPWPETDHVLPWDELDEESKKLFRRMAEVFAGFSTYTDHEIGRLLDFIEDLGEWDNTIFIVTSDNGASGEGTPTGSVNESLFFNGMPDSIEQNMEYFDVLGGIETYNHYPTGWAQAFCTPYKMYKRYVWNGGICDPLVISWPAKIKAGGELRHQYHHVSDIAPTIYEMLGIEFPDTVKNYPQMPLDGVSMAYTFENPDEKTAKKTQFYGLLGTRAMYKDGWKANTVHPATGGWDDFNNDKWELHHVDLDRSEMHDLADEHPEKLKELINLWFYEAALYHGLPIDDRSPYEMIGGSVKPSLVDHSRTRYVYYPNTQVLPEGDMAQIRGRSYDFLVEVSFGDKPEGVLFANGSRFGGHSLYVKDGRLKYVNNFVGLEEQMLVSDTALPTGDCTVGVAFEMENVDKEAMQTNGTATLYINDKKVAEQDIRTQLGGFSVAGEGFMVGRCAGAPVTPDYAGYHPWAFTGGTIKKVVVDVSGEAYIDLEMEAIAAMKRD